MATTLLPTTWPKALAWVAAAGVLLNAGCAVSRIKASVDLARASQPFEAWPATPTHHLLIVGDSTAVGTGASTPASSVAGRIAADHPDWRIVNRAADGAKAADLHAQLQAARADGPFDTVLVMAGGNDVIRGTDMDQLRADLRRSVMAARALAPRVVLMPCGNVGNAPFFWPPLSWWMTARSRALHDAVQQVARETGAEYVRLFAAKPDDPFAQQPERMNAADKLHPSDAGYALWRETLRTQAGF